MDWFLPSVFRIRFVCRTLSSWLAKLSYREFVNCFLVFSEMVFFRAQNVFSLKSQGTMQLMQHLLRKALKIRTTFASRRSYDKSRVCKFNFHLSPLNVVTTLRNKISKKFDRALKQKRKSLLCHTRFIALGASFCSFSLTPKSVDALYKVGHLNRLLNKQSFSKVSAIF